MRTFGKGAFGDFGLAKPYFIKAPLVGVKRGIVKTEFHVEKVGQTYFLLGRSFGELIAFSTSQVRHAE